MSNFLRILRPGRMCFGDVLMERRRQLKGGGQLLEWLLPRLKGDGNLQLLGAWTLHSFIESNRKDANALNRFMVQHNTLVPS